jgi:hypothetical protein
MQQRNRESQTHQARPILPAWHTLGRLCSPTKNPGSNHSPAAGQPNQDDYIKRSPNFECPRPQPLELPRKLEELTPPPPPFPIPINQSPDDSHIWKGVGGVRPVPVLPRTMNFEPAWGWVEHIMKLGLSSMSAALIQINLQDPAAAHANSKICDF